MSNSGINIDDFVEKMLSFRNQEMLSYLKEIRKKASLRHQKIIDQILFCLGEKKKRFEKEEIRQILIRHSALAHDIYVLRLREKKDQGIKILLEILKDDKEQGILRLLSAQMLLSICDRKAFEEVLHIANDKVCPINLLAKFAMIKRGIYACFPKTSISEVKKAKAFYRIIYIFSVRKNESISHLNHLLQDRNPIVSITAAYCLRKLSNSKELLHKADQKLLRYMKNGKTDEKDLALQCFWKNPKAHHNDRKRRRNFFYKFWLKRARRYKRTLCQALEGAPALKLSALRILIENSKAILSIKRRKHFSDIHSRVRKIYNSQKLSYSGEFTYSGGSLLRYFRKTKRSIEYIDKSKQILVFPFFSLAVFFCA